MCTSEPEVRMESECDHFRVNDFNLSTANVHPFPLAAMVSSLSEPLKYHPNTAPRSSSSASTSPNHNSSRAP